MALRLYNTMTATKELFEPRRDPVTLYVCGVTPYDTTHLGHARTYLTFDVLQRYLAYLGHAVRYVQNVTDIDDPLFAKARDLGRDYRDLANECIDIFLNDMREMNMRMPDVYPRVSEEIPYILETVRTLVDAGMAYPSNGYVFFRTSRFANFGAMSGLDAAGMKNADRGTGEDPDDPHKEHPLDFRLWVPSAPDEPAWPSDWGAGRPGWHIECSTMASRHLGATLDIHGGGADLIFPHHCSEIAQSESASGEHPFVRYWMHVGLVHMDGEKMSKSLGNLAFVRHLVPRFGGDALRYYLLHFPYRTPMEYFEDDLVEATARWTAIERAVRTGPAMNATPLGRFLTDGGKEIAEALDDDLDTALVVGLLDGLAEARDAASRSDLRLALRVLGFRAGE